MQKCLVIDCFKTMVVELVCEASSAEGEVDQWHILIAVSEISRLVRSGFEDRERLALPRMLKSTLHRQDILNTRWQ